MAKKQTKQQYIDELIKDNQELRSKINNMYSVTEYTDMKKKLKSKLADAEMMLHSSHIMKAYSEWQVNVFERFADFIPSCSQAWCCGEPLSCFNH